jgi:hypothetical protein
MPTQYISSTNTLTRQGARYEVNMLSDQITPGGALVDAFGRLRVSEPFTLFESQHRYTENDKWSTVTASGGSTTHVSAESAINMSVTTTTGSKVIRESKRVMPYQPGKSLLIMSTFVMATPVTGLRQRVGYFGNDNGIYLENDGTGNFLVLRSQSLGTTIRVPQSEWIGDKFNGSGYSDVTLDVTKSNIFWIDIEWLGVGDVRCGFIVHGKPVVAHVFHNDNVRTTTYMTTACLPIRYEIENLGSASGTLKQICSTAISEGGYNPESITYCQASSASVFVTRQTNATTADRGKFFNAVSIRLSSSKLDGIIIPTGVSIVIEQNKKYQWALIKNATFTTSPTWTVHPDCVTTEFAISDSIMTGGTIVKSGFLTNASESVELDNLGSLFLQLGRTQAGVSDVYTLAIAADATNSTFNALLNWYQII